MPLQKLHLSFDADKPELLSGAIPIVEKELVAGLDVHCPLGENSDQMVAVHLQPLSIAIGVDGVVGECEDNCFCALLQEGFERHLHLSDDAD